MEMNDDQKGAVLILAGAIYQGKVAKHDPRQPSYTYVEMADESVKAAKIFVEQTCLHGVFPETGK